VKHQKRPLLILSGKNYLYDFATPRLAMDDFTINRLVTTSPRRIWGPLWGVTFYNLLKRCDLFHSFNGVPFSNHKYIITFESYLPRVLSGFAAKTVRSVLSERLTHDRCRAVTALSQNAVTLSRHFNMGNRYWDEIETKLTVIYPSVKAVADKPVTKPKRLTLTFVGNDFGRKGGIACLVLSSMLNKAKIEHTMNIVGKCHYGLNSYTDCADGYYDKYIAAAKESNASISWLGSLGNAKILELMASSHFVLLPTLDDTFGFSILESMAAGTPVMATGQRALLEVIEDGVNSISLPLDLDDCGRWRYIGKPASERAKTAYERLIDDVHHAAADKMFKTVVAFLDQPSGYNAMAMAAIERIRRNHDPLGQAKLWGQTYLKSLRL
jgi:glycosyltransferase involved in cell wall biosynthesis